MKSPYVKPGYLEVYCGPMKSGKTREIINRIDKIKFVNNCRYLIVKPKVDTRNDSVVTRFGKLNFDCIFVDEKNPYEILEKISDIDLLVIDEGHFFDLSIINIIKELQKKGLHIIVAGLDLDFRGEPFGSMPYLLALSDKVYKLTAVCEHSGCYEKANRTQRLINGKPASYSSPIVLIGDEKEGYCVRCLRHHICERE